MRSGLGVLMALALLGFAPTGDPVQVGEDAPHLEVTPRLQLRLQDRAIVRDFRERWGDWVVRFDERDATPRVLLGPGVEVTSAEALVRDLAILAGVDPTDVTLEARIERGNRMGLRYRQYHRGAAVEGAVIDLFVDAGRISVIHASVHPGIAVDVRAGEVVVALPNARGGLLWAAATREETADEVVFRDQWGNVLHRYTTRHWLEVELEERTAGGPLIRLPAAEVTVSDALDSFLTDSLGAQPLLGPYDVTLEGPHVAIYLDPEPAPVFLPGVADDVVNAFADVTPSATAVQAYFHVGRAWLMATDATNPWIDDLVPATVEINASSCNAFYTGGTINFHNKEGDCVALGRIADVIFHEYGHGIHHYGLLGGVFAGDISEGSADYIAATINDDPYTGVGFTGPGTWIREIDSDRVYPDDVSGEVHNDGLIWASFLWNLRAESGAATTDPLFLEALTYGPTLPEAWVAVLAADDDDGDQTNGTPNDCALITLLNEHGIGPGPLGVVNYAHTPIEDQPTGAGPAAVAFSLSAANAGCSDLDPDSATIWWAIEEPGVDFADLTFSPIVPTRVETSYTAEIPAQFAGTRIAWFVQWGNVDGSVEVTSHGGESEAAYRYWVGDQAEVVCEDFEGPVATYTADGGGIDGTPPDGVVAWDVLTPAPGQPWSPANAADGTHIFGMAVDEDGEYLADNAQFANGPPLLLPAQGSRSLLHLRYQRWLSVEQSEYDVATVVLNGEEVWRNPAETALIDREWTPQVFDLRDRPDQGDDVRFAWTLQTDGGLEYGGWNLDAICLVALAEPERHYRATDLVATDDADRIAVSWTQPAVRPLFATALVRHSDHTPTALDDGLIVHLDLAPRPGALAAVEDPDAVPGQVYHYAVFAADSGENWYLSVVDGANADTGLIPTEQVPPGVDDTDPPAGEPAIDDEAKSGCGCTAARAPAGYGWLLLAGLALRRRAARPSHAHVPKR